MEKFLEPAVMAIWVPVLGGLIGLFLRLYFKDKSAQAEDALRSGAVIAYHMVNNVSALTPNKVDDKIALALKMLNEYMATKGQTLTEERSEQAKMIWNAMHGAEKVAGKLAAVPTLPSAPVP